MLKHSRLVSAALIGIWSNLSGANSYDIIDLGAIDTGTFSSANAINELGQIVFTGNTDAFETPQDERTQALAGNEVGILRGLSTTLTDAGTTFQELPLLPVVITPPVELQEIFDIQVSQLAGGVTDINDNGIAVGFSETLKPRLNEEEAVEGYTVFSRAVLYQNGQVSALPFDSDFSVFATGISDNDVVVGNGPREYFNEEGNLLGRPQRAWYYGLNDAEPTFTYVPMQDPNPENTSSALDVSSTGYIVGSSEGFVVPGFESSRFSRPYLFDSNAPEGEAIDLGDFRDTIIGEAFAVNDAGKAVGYSFNGNNFNPIVRAFLYENESLIDLGNLNPREIYSVARDINNSDQIVGFSQFGERVANPIYHAFLYQNGEMLDLNDMIDCDVVEQERWQLVDAHSINDQGYIVGTGLKGAETGGLTRAFLLVPRPGQEANQSCVVEQPTTEDDGGSTGILFLFTLFLLVPVVFVRRQQRNFKP